MTAPAGYRDPIVQRLVTALGEGWGGVEAAVVLGSGLGACASALRPSREARYADLPDLGVPRVPGHAGRLLRGTLAATEVLVFEGRRHVYEGISMAEAALPARVAAALGARLLLLLSAVGAVDPGTPVGSWVFVDDHVNLMGRNPLDGVCDERGPAFVDLTGLYRRDLFAALAQRLGARGVASRRGVLAGFAGPSYETPAEVRMARLLGASTVGMSTVPEAVWARYLGLDVVAWGRVANAAAGVGSGGVDHGDVLRAVARGAEEGVAVVEETLALWRESAGARS